MSYHPRFETTNLGSFLTTRARNSELWFINNDPYEQAILGYAARCVERYSTDLFALAIEGNHIQGIAIFPKANRAHFMRDFNSIVALNAPRYCKDFVGTKFWHRRYSAEIVPGDADIENEFFYTVLQPVQDGLVERLSEYPWYNCFHDAIHGIARKFKVVRWAEYNEKRRYCKNVKIKDYIEIVELKYKRLPGYEKLSQKEYAKIMQKKLEARRVDIVMERLKKKKGFLGREALLRMRPGSRPKNTKTSTRRSRRPRVLSVCHKRRATYRDWYFKRCAAFKEASLEYRNGNLKAKFPEGSYRPPLFTVKVTV
jgi:hypothetical protein